MADAAIASFVNLATLVGNIYQAVGFRKIAKSDFGWAIDDWRSYMVTSTPAITTGLNNPPTAIQAQRVLELNAKLGDWLAANGFRQSFAASGKFSIAHWRLPHFWLAKLSAQAQHY